MKLQVCCYLYELVTWMRRKRERGPVLRRKQWSVHTTPSCFSVERELIIFYSFTESLIPEWSFYGFEITNIRFVRLRWGFTSVTFMYLWRWKYYWLDVEVGVYFFLRKGIFFLNYLKTQFFGWSAILRFFNTYINNFYYFLFIFIFHVSWIQNCKMIILLV